MLISYNTSSEEVFERAKYHFTEKKFIDSMCFSGTSYSSHKIPVPLVHELREQALICCFISHLACLILHWAGPPTHQSVTLARQNDMQMSLWSGKSENEGETYLSRNLIHTELVFFTRANYFFYKAINYSFFREVTKHFFRDKQNSETRWSMKVIP